MGDDESIRKWYEREGHSSEFGPRGAWDPEGVREYYEREGSSCPISPMAKYYHERERQRIEDGQRRNREKEK